MKNMVSNSFTNVFSLWFRMLTAGRLSSPDGFLPSSLLCASKDTPGSRSVAATTNTYSNLYKDASTPTNCENGVKGYSSRPYNTSHAVFSFLFPDSFGAYKTLGFFICPITTLQMVAGFDWPACPSY
jgi:hypothetical protein